MMIIILWHRQLELGNRYRLENVHQRNNNQACSRILDLKWTWNVLDNVIRININNLSLNLSKYVAPCWILQPHMTICATMVLSFRIAFNQSPVRVSDTEELFWQKEFCFVLTAIISMLDIILRNFTRRYALILPQPFDISTLYRFGTSHRPSVMIQITIYEPRCTTHDAAIVEAKCYC